MSQDKVKRLGQERQENLGANNALFNTQLKYSVRKLVRLWQTAIN